MKLNVLVTGGAGFIGSNLTEELLKLGHKVCVLDNFSTGKRENIDQLLSNFNKNFIDEHFKLVEGDIRDLELCKEVCARVNYVFHQAALGSVPRSIKYPLLYEDVNIKGTLNMLEAAKISGVKRFVYASSSSVYGDSTVLPKKEGEEGVPLSPYALTKKVNELYALNYYQIYGLETIGLRYFNVFGPRQDPFSQYAAVIPKFVSMLLKGESPTINGDGEFSRDFTYVENVVQANINAAFYAHEDACGKNYNVACGKRTTLNQLYGEILKCLKLDIKPIYGCERAGDVPHSLADISMSKKYLNYRPEVSFEEGLEKAMHWYKSNL